MNGPPGAPRPGASRPKAPWERVRALGRRRYVVRAGLLGWALPVGLLSTFGTLALKAAGVIDAETVPEFVVWLLRTRPLWGLAALAGYAGLWVAGGIGVGLLLWRRQERRFEHRRSLRER